PSLIRTVMADFYSRAPQWQGFGGSNSRVGQELTSFDEALWSSITSTGGANPNELTVYADNMWTHWNGSSNGSSYGLIRDINVAIDGIEEASSPTLDPLKPELIAELRYIRAWTYFEHVKRMGGVPILTEQQIYDFS